MSSSFKLGFIDSNADFIGHIKSFLNLAEEDFFYWNSIENFYYSKLAGKIQLLFLELDCLGLSYSDFLTILQKQFSDLKIAILSQKSEGSTIQKCIAAGASGFILKSEIDTLPEVISIIRKGGCILSPGATFQILNLSQENESNPSPRLTIREKQVLERLREGRSIPEISRQLFISLDTAKFHVKNIYKKFDVNSRLGLLQKVGELHLR